MYLMVETIRVESDGDIPERKAARQAFKTELGEKLESVFKSQC